MKSNNIIVDLNKVQYAWFYYVNQYGEKSHTPFKHSVHGIQYQPNDLHIAVALTGERITLEEYAIKFKLKDVWTPEVKLQLTANHRLTYTSDRARSIYKEWCRRQFKPRKKPNNKG